MSEINFATNKLRDEFQSPVNQLNHKKDGEIHILKVNYESDGHVNFAVHINDDQVCKLENYKMDYSNTRYERLCTDDHCKSTIEYGLIEDSALDGKIRIQEKYDNLSDHFNVNLSLYDKNGNVVGEYGAELSFQPDEYNSFIIHDFYDTTNHII